MESRGTNGAYDRPVGGGGKVKVVEVFGVAKYSLVIVAVLNEAQSLKDKQVVESNVVLESLGAR